jgi:hypothetical protein
MSIATLHGAWDALTHGSFANVSAEWLLTTCYRNRCSNAAHGTDLS